jgi:hypothetical protein
MLKARRRPELVKEKLQLIDEAFKRMPTITSLADLGGVWGVDAGYTFYAVEHHNLARAILVDLTFRPAVRARAQTFPELKLLHANFALPATAEQLGEVDAVLLFDVLLHQVRPNWDEMLEIYAGHTKAFIIFNQQYLGSSTIRLTELSKKEYFRNVPKLDEYLRQFDHLDDVDPTYPNPEVRTWRDSHHLWQWGITDEDLRSVMTRLGFEELSYINHGGWRDLPEIEDHSFFFAKRSG